MVPEQSFPNHFRFHFSFFPYVQYWGLFPTMELLYVVTFAIFALAVAALSGAFTHTQSTEELQRKQLFRYLFVRYLIVFFSFFLLYNLYSLSYHTRILYLPGRLKAEMFN